MPALADLGYWTGSITYPAQNTTINFGAVDASGVAWLWQKIEGWDSPDTSGQVIQKAGDHGAWASPQFYAARALTWTIMASAPTQAQRDAARAALQQAVPVSDLATLVYNEPVPKQVACRRSGRITETYPTFNDVAFTVGLICPDPRKYAVLVQQASANASVSTLGVTLPFTMPVTLTAQPQTGTIVVTNNGNFETRPVVTIYGPITSPSLTDTTTGETVSWSYLTLISGQALVVDFNVRQATSGGSFFPADLPSTWFVCQPGSTQILLGGATTGGASMSATWQDSWI